MRPGLDSTPAHCPTDTPTLTGRLFCLLGFHRQTRSPYGIIQCTRPGCRFLRLTRDAARLHRERAAQRQREALAIEPDTAGADDLRPAQLLGEAQEPDAFAWPPPPPPDGGSPGLLP